jgi:hypothetical protein
VNKLDLKKELKHLYQPSAKEVEQADVSPMNFPMLDCTADSAKWKAIILQPMH